tara:strand:+ start:249 stop:1118 length:870 start_codon:yes stop_codon:yes gene_type:complete
MVLRRGCEEISIMQHNKIIQGDCIQILSESIEKQCIDLIFADPPYNLSGSKLDLKNNTTGGAFYKVNEEWDTFSEEEYLHFTASWIEGCKRVLKDNGSLYISCTHHNIGELIIAAKKLEFDLKNIITWYKVNAMPNITKRTFTHSTEFVLWFVKGKKWVFNYEDIKKFNPNKTKSGEDKQMRDFLNFIELPIVQGKERMRGEDGKALHPTQKPEKLLELVILASSNEGGVVLDPFFGTGTTGFVAEKMHRKWVGIEMQSDYVKLAKKRLKSLHDKTYQQEELQLQIDYE